MISKNVKIFLCLSLVSIILPVLGGVSAQGVDDTHEVTVTDTTPNISSNIIEQGNEINPVKQINTRDVTEASVSSYEELKTKINEARDEEVQIDLEEKTYAIDESMVWGTSDTAKILCINGNGATIDGKNVFQFLTVEAGYTLHLNNMIIQNTAADMGSAITNYGTLYINNVTFKNNTAIKEGGAIYSEGTLNIENNSHFTANRITCGVNGGGGAAICSSGKFTVEESNFFENVAAGSNMEEVDEGCGGAINIKNTAQEVSITASNFTKNSARHGGAIYINSNDRTNNKITIKGNNFTLNKAISCGAVETYRQANITNNNFTKNTLFYEETSETTSGGGAILLNSGKIPYTVIAINNTFIENEAQHDDCAGVIMTCRDATLVSSNNVYRDNRAIDTAVIYNMGTATFTNDVFTGNSAVLTGVFTHGGHDLTITNCTFEENNAMCDLLYARSPVTITESTISCENLETLIVKGDSKITAVFNTVNGECLEKGLIKTNLTISHNTEIRPDEENLITATLTDATNVPVVGKKVNVLIDGIKNESRKSNDDGMVSYCYNPSEGKITSIQFAFAPEDYYIGSESEELISDFRIKTSLTIENVQRSGKENAYVVKGELRDAYHSLLADKMIYLNVDGITVNNARTGADENSQGRFEISFTRNLYGFTTGEHTITLLFCGDDKYVDSKAQTTFICEKSDISIRFDDLKSVKKGERITISGAVTDNCDNPMTESVIKLLINNGRKTLKTDGEGRFAFDYALNRVGENNITATFYENEYYNQCVEKVTVVVLPLNTFIVMDQINPVAKGHAVTITGRLTDENGEKVAYAQVRVFVNGSPKTIKCDANGVFKHVYVMGRIGENNISVTYRGSNSYAASEASTRVEVSKAVSLIIIDDLGSVDRKDNVTIRGRISDENGGAIAYAQVKITVNGSPKTVKCDADGVFIHSYVMNRIGENDITVFFNGNNRFSATNSTRIVVVNPKKF